MAYANTKKSLTSQVRGGFDVELIIVYVPMSGSNHSYSRVILLISLLNSAKASLNSVNCISQLPKLWQYSSLARRTYWAP